MDEGKGLWRSRKGKFGVGGWFVAVGGYPMSLVLAPGSYY
jgi:hypothetical protein